VSAQRGFFATLFDLSFTEFVALRLMRVLYVLGIIGSGIGALVFIVGGFSHGAGVGVLALILSPAIFTLLVIVCRVQVELMVVLFSIAQSVGDIAKGKASPPQPSATPAQDGE